MVAYEELYEDVKKLVSEKRFNHILGVVERAEEYAKVYNVNLENARIAAVLHDIAKEIPQEQSYKMLSEYGVELDETEKKNFNLVHSKLGAAFAKYKYGLSDDIVNAICYHTTGRANMSMLEKIIYLADATEKGRAYIGKLNMLTLDEVVNLVKKDIIAGLNYILNYTLNSLLNRGLYIHINTVEAYNYYLNNNIVK